LGTNISFQKTSPAGIYELAVTQNPTSGTPGTFSGSTAWGLTLTNLGVTNTLDASIVFNDDTLPTPVALTSGSFSTPVGIIPNGFYWTDNTQVDVYFEVPGGDLGNTIHQVNIYFHTSGSPADYSIRAISQGSGSSNFNVNQLNFTSINDNFGGVSSGVHLQFFDLGSDFYRMAISANPLMCTSSLTDCEFDVNEDWVFSINGLSASNETVVSIESFPYGASPAAITPDPVNIYYPPLAVIRNPGNQQSTNPVKIVANRDFRYRSDPFDTDKTDAQLDYQWDLDGGSFASNATEQNPNFDESFSTTGTHTVDLSVQESYPLGTTPGFPYVDVDYDTKDQLAIEVVDPEYVLFPPHVNVAGSTWLDPPEIDGKVSTIYSPYTPGDTGWNQAHRIIYQDGTDSHVTFQSLCHRSDDYLFMSFEVRNDPSLDQYDAIYLAFSPDNTAATRSDDRMIIIKPFSSSPATGTNLLPYEVKERTWNSGTSQWDTQTLSESGGVYDYNILVKVKNDFTSGSSWNVEIRIPTSTTTGTGSWVNFSNNFLFSFIVFRVDNSGADPIVSEFKWPRYTTDILGDVESYDYNPSWWGEAVQGYSDVTLYNGLYFLLNEILVTPSTGGGSGTNITLPNCSSVNSVTNTFEMTLYNDCKKSTISGPQYFALKDIDVAFSVAQWGIVPAGSPEWQLVPSFDDSPSVANPTTQSSIGAGSGSGPASQTVTLPWVIDCTNDTTTISDYAPPHDHQCIYVEILDAQVATAGYEFEPVNILTRSIYRNFNFVTASEFSRTAVVSTKGYGPPQDGSKNHKITISVVKDKWTKRKNPDKPQKGDMKTTTGQKPGQALPEQQEEDVVSYLSWSATGYLHTGQTVVLNGKPFELTEPMGSFGYVVEHEGEVGEWEDDIEGAEEVAEDTYTLEIPVDDVKDIVTRITPLEPPEPVGCISVHGGVSIPLNTFADDYGMGPSGLIDIGYRIFPNLYLLGLFGYHSFPANDDADVDDLSMITAALNLKYFIQLAAFRLGIGAGLAVYIPDMDFGQIDFGYDAKVSVDYDITRMLTLEVGAIYYSTFEQKNWFLQSHAGIILNF
jgi:hypothetical protein